MSNKPTDKNWEQQNEQGKTKQWAEKGPTTPGKDQQRGTTKSGSPTNPNKQQGNKPTNPW